MVISKMRLDDRIIADYSFNDDYSQVTYIDGSLEFYKSIYTYNLFENKIISSHLIIDFEERDPFDYSQEDREYDENNNLISKTLYSYSNNEQILSGKSTYEYDEFNRCIKNTFVSYEGDSIYIDEISYVDEFTKITKHSTYFSNSLADEYETIENTTFDFDKRTKTVTEMVRAEGEEDVYSAYKIYRLSDGKELEIYNFDFDQLIKIEYNDNSDFLSKEYYYVSSKNEEPILTTKINFIYNENGGLIREEKKHGFWYRVIYKYENCFTLDDNNMVIAATSFLCSVDGGIQELGTVMYEYVPIYLPIDNSIYMRAFGVGSYIDFFEQGN